MGRKRALSAEMLARLHAEYLAGASIPELAERYGLVHSTIDRAFKREGLALKSKEEKDQGKVKKQKSTNLARYGVENVANYQPHKEKQQQTMTERYGVSNPQQSEDIRAATRETVKKRYGHEYFFGSDAGKAKIQEILEQKWGVSHPSKNNDILEKARKSRIASRRARLLPLLKEKGYELLEDYVGNRITVNGAHYSWRAYRLKHTCGNEFEDDVFMDPRCPVCFPRNRSNEEIRIADYIKSLGFNIEVTYRNLIKNPITGKPYEVDIYLPEQKVAFEYNGLWWHHLRKDHGLKTDLCLEQGVRLFHLWEFKDPNIVRSRICQVLGKTPKSYGARATKVIEIDSKQAKQFFKENHFQGSAKAFLRLGLVADDQLVSAMSFRLSKEGIPEIARYACATFTHVAGGFNKLLKAALPKLPGNLLLSYADRDLTPDWRQTVYAKYGFSFQGDSGPMLFYYNRHEKKFYPREAYQRWKLKTIFPEYYSENLTADEMLCMAGVYILRTSGNFKFILSF